MGPGLRASLLGIVLNGGDSRFLNRAAGGRHCWVETESPARYPTSRPERFLLYHKKSDNFYLAESSCIISTQKREGLGVGRGVQHVKQDYNSFIFAGAI